MRKTFFLFSFLMNFSLFAQSKTEIDLGLRLRVTPVWFNNSDVHNSEKRILMEEDAHLSGLSISGGIRRKVLKNFYVGYRAFIRYDELFAELSQYPDFHNDLKFRLMIDHSFYGSYSIINRKKWSGEIGLGVSFNNRNTEYSYNIYRPSPIGGFDQFSNKGNFNFSTFDIPITVKSGKFRYNLTTSFSDVHAFEPEYSSFILFNLGAVYSLNLKSKK